MITKAEIGMMRTVLRDFSDLVDAAERNAVRRSRSDVFHEPSIEAHIAGQERAEQLAKHLDRAGAALTAVRAHLAQAATFAVDDKPEVSS